MNREATLSDAILDVDIAIAARDYDHAIALTNELLTAHPDAVGVWRAKARAYESSGHALSAAESFGRVLDFLPGDPDAMAGLARTLDATGKADEARIWARQALDYLPASRETVLQHIASSAAEPELEPIVGASDYMPDKDSLILKAAMVQAQAGLMERSIALFRQVLAHRPDRIDAKVALAAALWRNSARIAAADTCASILDEQPECLNAHLILLQFWGHANTPQQEKYHRDVIERIDPDHRVTAQLLGAQSPLPIIDVPAAGQPALVTATQPAEEDEQSRADWVDNLVAAASSTPKPLERVDSPPPPDQSSLSRTAVVDDTSETDIDAADDLSDIGSFAKWDWSPNETIEVAQDGFDASWLGAIAANAPPGFVPSRPVRATPDARDGVPEQVEALEWREGDVDESGSTDDPGSSPEDGPHSAPAASAEPTPDVAIEIEPQQIGAASAAGLSTTKNLNELMAEAQLALSEDRLQDAAALFKRIIPLLRGRPLDALIAELDTVTKAHPSKPLFDSLGLAYARKRDMPAALEAYRKAMANDES